MYFDGKINKMWQVVDGQWRRIKGSNTTVVRQPDGQHLGFFTAEKGHGTGRDVASGVLNHLEHVLNLDIKDLICVGGDGCMVNLGPWSGVFTELENILKRPLQRVVCMLHHVELPLRALFHKIDGKRSGPESFTGPLGDLCRQEVWLYKLRKFPLIPADFPRLPQENYKKMSKDAKLMYNYCVGIVDGDIPLKLANRVIGQEFSARWITFGTRLLRLWVSEKYDRLPAEQQENLDTMAYYIVWVYYKVFSNIKFKDTIVDGPLHLFDEVRFAKQLLVGKGKAVEFETVKSSIQMNSSMAHPESTLLAMCGEGCDPIRLQGLAFIQEMLDIEKYEKTTSLLKKPLRAFELPYINFEAKNYFELMIIKYKPIHGSKPYFGRVLKQPYFRVFTPNSKARGEKWVKMTIPPLIRSMTPEEIQSLKTKPLEVDYPCHSQTVEHGVALSSKMAERYVRRDHQLQAVLQASDARKLQPGQVTHRGFRDAIKKM